MTYHNPLVAALGHNVQWLNFKLVERDGKITKVPYYKKTQKASSTDTNTWKTYDEAAKDFADQSNEFDGVGIIFKPDQRLLGIDIDHVLDENGDIVGEHADKIQRLIAEANTYTEISPSGTGLHLMLIVPEGLPLIANRHSPFEAYTSKRFFTVTERLYGEEKEVRVLSNAEALDLLGIIGYPWGKDEPEALASVTSSPSPLPNTLEDAAVVEKMFTSKNGEKIKALYGGDTSKYEGDESRADMALCSYLAFWTGKDAAQMERVWVASTLGARKKTQDRKDYRDRTITAAIRGCTNVYSSSVSDMEPYEEPVDTSKFKPLSTSELLDILDLTIKHDNENKLAVFLCLLSAFTENSQFNISLNAPSSTGKTYIPMETVQLFPEDDRIEIGYCSPMAFFHESGIYNKETNTYTVDLSRKILIFLDMPHNELLARMRPLFSHDKRVIESKITDKNQKGGNKTKRIQIIGFPAVIFCTAGLNIDEQEATRFFLLSPEISQDKIHAGIESLIRKEANSDQVKERVNQDPQRLLLKERIQGIKQEKITQINIANPQRIEDLFLAKDRMLIPRMQRDAKRLTSLVKAFALLNVWFREREGNVITANDEDVTNAIQLWEKISVSQELNLPPYVYDLYVKVILVALEEKKQSLEGEFPDEEGRIGLTYQEILEKHHKTEGRPLGIQKLTKDILPMLEAAGLISREKSITDLRMWIVYPLIGGSVIDALAENNLNNSSESSGVDEEFDDPFKD
jgi:hypothetical protein